MKKLFLILIALITVSLTACTSKNIGIIGGSDGPTQIIVTDNSDGIIYNNYVNEKKLPQLDMAIVNPFVFADTVVVLDDSIDNELELVVYEMYKNIVSCKYADAKKNVIDNSLIESVNVYEKNYSEGLYYKRIVFDDIELVGRDDLDDITITGKDELIKLINELNILNYGIVELDYDVVMNDKMRERSSYVANNYEVKRYCIVAKIDGAYKICKVFDESFLDD